MNDFPPVGERIRRARELQGRSLRSIARDTGLSPSLLSQIETGKIRPSVRTLYQVTSNLGLSVDEVLHGDPALGGTESLDGGSAGPVQHADENPRIDLTTGVVWERLAVGGRQGLEPLRVTYGPGATSSNDGAAMTHVGWEFAYVMSGEIELELDGSHLHRLGVGDTLSFDSRRSHRYRNPTEGDTVLLFVIMHDGASQPLRAFTDEAFPDAEAPTS